MRHRRLLTAAALSCTLLLPAGGAWAQADSPARSDKSSDNGGPAKAPARAKAAAAKRKDDAAKRKAAAEARAAAARQRRLLEELRREAEQRLAADEADLAAAQRKAAVQRERAFTAEKKAAVARRELGNMAREVYVTGPTEWLGLESLIDSPDPAGSMRRSGVASRLAEHQDVEWSRALQAADRAAGLRAQADALVAQAKQRVVVSQTVLDGINGKRDLEGVAAGGQGTAALTRLCLAADAVVDLCAAPKWSETNLTLDAVIIERHVAATWPEIRDVGGWRPSDPYPDHPSGRAVDIMMPNAGSGGDVALGDEIARYYQEHAAEYGIYYMIWRQRIWKSTDPIGHWSPMADRGSPTANHMDHVHITVSDGVSGTAFTQALLRARADQRPAKRSR